MSFLASFTNSVLQFLLYSPALEMSHVKRVKCEAVRILGDGDQCVGDLGIAVFLPIPNIADTTSHPLMAWKNGSTLQR